MVRGECDIVAAPVLRERLLGLLAGKAAVLGPDLSGLDFLDRAGARVVLAAGHCAALPGGALAIAAPTPPVARLLPLTSLDRHLTIFSGPARPRLAVIVRLRFRRGHAIASGARCGGSAARHPVGDRLVERRAEHIDDGALPAYARR